MVKHPPRLALLLGLLACVLLLTACFGSGFHYPWESVGPQASGGKPGPLGPRDEFAHLLAQLQWLFIGLGVAAFIASIWVPLISTRHAVGSIVLGVGIALIKPFVIALYWPTIICLALAGLAAIWPYAVAIYTWAKARFTGKSVALTAGIPSLKSLIAPREPNVLAAPGSVPVGAGPSVPEPPSTGGGAG